MKKRDVGMAKDFSKKYGNLKSISVLSGCLSMPDATSLHHCLQNHHQYCIILQKRGSKVYVISFLYSKCSTFKAAWVCGQSYGSISHNPTKCA